MNKQGEALADKLFPEDERMVFTVLDGASVQGLRQRLASDAPQHECLYRGDLEPDMAEVAPYLVQLELNSPFTEWVLEQGWGKHWGIFGQSAADLRELRQHFRRFLTVHDPEGRPLYFRYYDPRVLRVYLPTCSADELKELFGPVQAYFMEDDTGSSVLRFLLKDGKLSKQSEALLAKPAAP